MNKAIGYKMTHDTGFAPNPFHGALTLATCKPAIRRTRVKDDWVAGFASKALVQNARAYGVSIPYGGLVYLMQLTEEPLELAAYFNDVRFLKKRPVLDSNDAELRSGDNIYWRDADGLYRQVPNKSHSVDEALHDTSGKNALVSTRFWYFGRNCFVPLGGWKALMGSELSSGRTFYCPDRFVEGVLDQLKVMGMKPGIHGRPCIWDEAAEKACGEVLQEQMAASTCSPPKSSARIASVRDCGLPDAGTRAPGSTSPKPTACR